MTPTTDNRVAMRAKIVIALAEADGADLTDPHAGARYRGIYSDKALSLLGRKDMAAGLPPVVVDLVSEYRDHEAALLAERNDRRDRNGQAIASMIEAKRGPEPDYSHRTLHLRDEATGQLYGIRLPVELLTFFGHNEAEVDNEAAGRPFVKRATTAA